MASGINETPASRLNNHVVHESARYASATSPQIQVTVSDVTVVDNTGFATNHSPAGNTFDRTYQPKTVHSLSYTDNGSNRRTVQPKHLNSVGSTDYSLSSDLSYSPNVFLSDPESSLDTSYNFENNWFADLDGGLEADEKARASPLPIGKDLQLAIQELQAVPRLRWPVGGSIVYEDDDSIRARAVPAPCERQEDIENVANSILEEAQSTGFNNLSAAGTEYKYISRPIAENQNNERQSAESQVTRTLTEVEYQQQVSSTARSVVTETRQIQQTNVAVYGVGQPEVTSGERPPVAGKPRHPPDGTDYNIPWKVKRLRKQRVAKGFEADASFPAHDVNRENGSGVDVYEEALEALENGRWEQDSIGSSPRGQSPDFDDVDRMINGFEVENAAAPVFDIPRYFLPRSVNTLDETEPHQPAADTQGKAAHGLINANTQVQTATARESTVKQVHKLPTDETLRTAAAASSVLLTDKQSVELKLITQPTDIRRDNMAPSSENNLTSPSTDINHSVASSKVTSNTNRWSLPTPTMSPAFALAPMSASFSASQSLQNYDERSAEEIFEDILESLEDTLEDDDQIQPSIDNSARRNVDSEDNSPIDQWVPQWVGSETNQYQFDIQQMNNVASNSCQIIVEDSVGSSYSPRPSQIDQLFSHRSDFEDDSVFASPRSHSETTSPPDIRIKVAPPPQQPSSSADTFDYELDLDLELELSANMKACGSCSSDLDNISLGSSVMSNDSGMGAERFATVKSVEKEPVGNVLTVPSAPRRGANRRKTSDDNQRQNDAEKEFALSDQTSAVDILFESLPVSDYQPASTSEFDTKYNQFYSDQNTVKVQTDENAVGNNLIDDHKNWTFEDNDANSNTIRKVINADETAWIQNSKPSPVTEDNTKETSENVYKKEVETQQNFEVVPNSSEHSIYPKQKVQVLSEEVTTQEIVLKVVWPKKKKMKRNLEMVPSVKQPFRELHIHRVIRMADFDHDVFINESHGSVTGELIATAADERTRRDRKSDSEIKKRLSITGPSSVAGSDDNKTALAKLDQALAVEFEKHVHSHSVEEVLDSQIDVVQDDSVKILRVPDTAVHTVQSLSNVIQRLGRAVTDGCSSTGVVSGTKQSSNIRVTCDAVERKSSSTQPGGQDVTVIRTTLLDTNNPNAQPTAMTTSYGRRSITSSRETLTH